MVKKYLKATQFSNSLEWSFLAIRILFGVGMALHGWGKIQNPMGWAPPDAGIPAILQLLAAVSEFGGGIALAVGLLTRLGCLGMAFTMAVAVAMHAFVLKDPFVSPTGGSSYELAALYFVIAVTFVVVGPGKLSLDAKLFGKN